MVLLIKLKFVVYLFFILLLQAGKLKKLKKLKNSKKQLKKGKRGKHKIQTFGKLDEVHRAVYGQCNVIIHTHGNVIQPFLTVTTNVS
jgi:hypothetical protein